MAEKIDQLILPDSTGTEQAYDIDLPPDATININSINGMSANAMKNGMVHSLMSGITTTPGSSSSSSYLSVKWTVDDVDGITQPFDGMKLIIKIPLAGVGTAGAVLSIDGGTTYHPIAYNVNTVFTTHFPVNSVKVFTYNASQTMTAYLTAKTASSITGVWQADANYDTNTTMTYGTLAYYFRMYAAQTIYRYKLIALDKDNRAVPIVTTNRDETATYDYAASTTYAKDAVVHRFASGISKWYKSLQASNKGHAPEAAASASWWAECAGVAPTTLSFRPEKIYWYSTTTTINAGAAVGGNVLQDIGYNATYMAYCNFNEGVLAYHLFYLCGKFDPQTGLFTLRDGGTVGSKLYYTSVPANTANITLSNYFTDGYDYILVGGSYSTNNYLHIMDNNPMFHFDGTNLVPYQTWKSNQIAGVHRGSAMTWYEASYLLSGDISKIKINDIYWQTADGDIPSAVAENDIFQVTSFNTTYNTFECTKIAQIPPLPTIADAGKIVSVNSQGNYILTTLSTYDGTVS